MFLKPSYELELLNSERYKTIVGIDEAGRGCWAGPVAVGAYIFRLESAVFEGINDSKKIPSAKRQLLFENLTQHEHVVELASPTDIDLFGITGIIEKIIQKIVRNFSDSSTLFLIDGHFKKDFGEHTQQCIKGDSKYYSVAAASILAKVKRDRLMQNFALEYPKYGFENHKGYGTKFHRDMLNAHGICDLHRKSYRPIAELVTKTIKIN